MASGTIEVNSSTIRKKACELKSLNKKFMSLVSTLKTTESTLNSMWDGEANDAFHKAFASDEKQMETFHGEIEKYASALESIATQYEKVEKVNVSMASSRTYH